MMTTIEEVETAVAQFTPQQLAAFRAWFAEHDAQRWDQQFETDVAAGRLDGLAAEALKDYRAGRTSAL